MSFPKNWRVGLSFAWILSCVAGWSVRKIALNVTQLSTRIDTAAPSMRFEIYSDVEAVSRGIQGCVFFAIVSAVAISRFFRSLQEGS